MQSLDKHAIANVMASSKNLVHDCDGVQLHRKLPVVLSLNLSQQHFTPKNVHCTADVGRSSRDHKMTTASPQVYVPAIAVAHTFGLILLLYSLEKVYGIFSKLGRRLRPRRQKAEKTASKKVILEPDEVNGTIHKIEEEETDDAASVASSSSQDDQTERSNHDWDSSAEARARAGIIAEAEPHVLTPPWIRGCSCEVIYSTSYLNLQAIGLVNL